MNKLLPLIIGSFLVFGAVGCGETISRTSTNAPENTNETVNAPTHETAQKTENHATSETRKRQLESDIRAREQRNNITADGGIDRSDPDVKSEIRDKLEANLPASQLTVNSKDGAVTVTGTVPTQEQLNKVHKLAQEIKGVESVMLDVKVAPATVAPKKS